MPKRILIADDNRAMADVIRFNFERAGYEVTVASNGREAWDHLQVGHFDCVLTDYQMPEMSGEDLCLKMREDKRFAQTPVVLLSAKGLEIDSAQLIEKLKLHSIVFKPFSPRQVVESIETCLCDVPARL